MATVDVPIYEETASDSYTKLLLHCDGTNGSTVITDKIGKAMTAYGNAKISTAQSKFRGASLSLDGNGDYISSPNSADFRFGTGDFTIDFWLYSNVAWGSQPASASVCGQKKSDSTNGWVLYKDGSYPTKINARVGLTNNFPTGSTPTANVWEHWALVRNGTSLKWYKNGVLDATTTSSVDVNDTTGLFLIGLADSWASSFLNGYVDELRVSKGIARWTANFTPPTAPYDTTITQTPVNTNVEIKSQYRGLSGVNRQIKEQYRGYDGANRLVFGTSRTYLYKEGDEYASLTGGWEFIPNVGWNSGALPILEKTSAYIRMSGTSQNWKGSRVRHSNEIDFTPYNKLFVDVTYDNPYMVSAGNEPLSYIDVLDTTSHTSTMLVRINPDIVGRNVWEVDLSSVNTKAVTHVAAQTGSDRKIDAIIHAIWLE